MVSSVSSNKFDTHGILTILLFKSCVGITLAAVELHIPLGISTNEDIEEVSSALVLWLEFKLETLFTNKIQNKYLMIFIFNKILTLLDAYHFSRNKSYVVGYGYIQK